jgi:hypothetical protein
MSQPSFSATTKRESDIEEDRWRRVLREAFRRRLLRDVMSTKAEIAHVSDAAQRLTGQNRMRVTARLEMLNGNVDRVIARLRDLDKPQLP